MHALLEKQSRLRDYAVRRKEVQDAEAKVAEQLRNADKEHEERVQAALMAGELPPRPPDVGDSPKIGVFYRAKLNEIDNAEAAYVTANAPKLAEPLQARQAELLERVRKRIPDLSAEVEELKELVRSYNWIRGRMRIAAQGVSIPPAAAEHQVTTMNLIEAVLDGDTFLPTRDD